MTRSADDIRRRMQNLRHDLKVDVDGIAESTREMSDWRIYVKRYPWVCLGAAAAAGYMVVPKRLELMSPTADELLKLAKKHKLVVEAKPQAHTRRGLASTIFGLVGTMAVRGAIAYAGHHFGKRGGELAAAEPDEIR